jgi:23S rRNA (adenine2030-N6)-methyltransferase
VNYRHAYHAGNGGDVLKHLTLMLALEHLTAKDTPVFYLDTHAGRGLYPLDDPATQKGGEYRSGIVRVLEAMDPPAAISRYLALVRSVGGASPALLAYPGSPRVALSLLRAQDHLALCEQEPAEAAALKRVFHAHRNVAVHERDGYEALKALLPPRQKRGLVLIDPPYEQAEEWSRLAQALDAAITRWPTGMYLVWYPIAPGPEATRFKGRARSTGIRRQLVAELLLRPEDTPVGLIGAGMLLINPPWRLDTMLAQLLPWLGRAMAGDGARAKVEWLVPE